MCAMYGKLTWISRAIQLYNCECDNMHYKALFTQLVAFDGGEGVLNIFRLTMLISHKCHANRKEEKIGAKKNMGML